MSSKTSAVTHERSAQFEGSSPWSFGDRVKLLLWHFAWTCLCEWTPKPANQWRLFVLRLFGTEIHGKPFVHNRARIQIPWHLRLDHRSSVGDRANLYSLGFIHLREHCIIAQEAYLCTGTHDMDHEAKPLITAPITVGEHAFVAARAFVMPGVSIGSHAIVGACSVVVQNVNNHETVVGNPAKPISSKKTEHGK